MAGLSQPRITKTQQSTQLSYELPHRIHTVKIYPIKSPNGSTIILYGHENGVRIVWRGGRAFRRQAAASAPKKTNGAKEAVISLESDDEERAVKAFEDKPEFEESEQELDPSKPYPSILQTLDLQFGTDVQHLATLPSPALKAEGPSWRGLDSMKKKIVFTAACGDSSLRLVTIPLTPPSPESKARPEFRSNFIEAHAGKGQWDETVVVIAGHSKPSDGVAMTADFSRSESKQESGKPESQIIIASHSKEVTGLLLLFKISVTSPEPRVEPFQKIFLASPAKSLSFNPSLSAQRFSQLLIAEAAGVCRIYDYNEVPVKRLEASEVDQGSFLLSLYTSFRNPKDQYPPRLGIYAGLGRKNIVDAQWVAAGAAVVVLTSDGEWALWDIEGAGPGASKNQTIHGGSATRYSLSGYIDTGTKSRQTSLHQTSTSKFAPMTPSTRKFLEPFGAKGSNSSVQGQISIIEIPGTSPIAPLEESIVFWLGESYTIIPSLSKYWAANSRKSGSGSLFGNTTIGSRMLRLEGFDLEGERCTSIDQLVTGHGSLPELLVSSEHRLAILTTESKTRDLKPKQPQRLALTEKSANNEELDVLGIDQALARMENGNSRRVKLFQS